MTNLQDVPFSIADDFYLIGLDERTTRPRLHAKAMGLATGAALLAELVLSNHIAVVDDRIVVAPRYQPPADRHLATMLGHLVAEPEHDLQTWLSFFAQTSTDAVLDRLVTSGVLRAEVSRGLLRTRETFTPADPVAVSWRSLRIAHVISKRDLRTWEDLTLVGLLAATGLVDLVMYNASSDDLENLRLILARLADELSLHALITRVEALIAAAVMAQRR